MIDTILEERGKNYGNFYSQADLAQNLKVMVSQHYYSLNKENMPNYMAESLAMICHKMARIVNGDPAYVDSWQDIAGYAQLVVDILEESNKQLITNGEK